MLLRKGFVDSDRAWKYALNLPIMFGKKTEYVFGNGGKLIPPGLNRRCLDLYGGQFDRIVFENFDYTGFSARRSGYDFYERAVAIALGQADFWGFGINLIYEGENYNLRDGELFEFNPCIYHSATSTYNFWLMTIYRIYS
jgi:hypothetical protein